MAPRTRRYLAVSTTDKGEPFEHPLAATLPDDAIAEASRLSCEATGCQTVDVQHAAGELVATCIDLDT